MILGWIWTPNCTRPLPFMHLQLQLQASVVDFFSTLFSRTRSCVRPACICAVLCGALTQRKAKEKKEEKRNGSNDGCAKLVPNLQRERELRLMTRMAFCGWQFDTTMTRGWRQESHCEDAWWLTKKKRSLVWKWSSYSNTGGAEVLRRQDRCKEVHHITFAV